MTSKVFLLFLILGMVSANFPGFQHQTFHHVAHPYKFSYNIRDKTGRQYRQEYGDGHSRVKGSYGFTDASGIERHVNYVADDGGFRAQVRTNEPGTATLNPAHVYVIANPPYSTTQHDFGNLPHVGNPNNVLGCGEFGCGYRGPLNGGYILEMRSGHGFKKFG